MSLVEAYKKKFMGILVKGYIKLFASKVYSFVYFMIAFYFLHQYFSNIYRVNINVK